MSLYNSLINLLASRYANDNPMAGSHIGRLLGGLFHRSPIRYPGGMNNPGNWNPQKVREMDMRIMNNGNVGNFSQIGNLSQVGRFLNSAPQYQPIEPRRMQPR